MKETEKTTMNSSIYKKMMRKRLYNEEGICYFCRPHDGCNGWGKFRRQQSWKEHRKYQYKEQC
jgi:hypothetical protein